jgi:MOSC domain-containing protein YiiM
MTVLEIYITSVAKSPLQSVKSVRALAGRGLEGDRYCASAPAAAGEIDAKSHMKILGKQLTLIESEAIDALQRDCGIKLLPRETRRNIITRGVALNHLVGREFNIGRVRVKGIRLCEPCGHLESLTQQGVRESLIHRGGLRAQILTDGVIHVGDLIHNTTP